jgi:hypothetical protein
MHDLQTEIGALEAEIAKLEALLTQLVAHIQELTNAYNLLNFQLLQISNDPNLTDEEVRFSRRFDLAINLVVAGSFLFNFSVFSPRLRHATPPSFHPFSTPPQPRPISPCVSFPQTESKSEKGKVRRAGKASAAVQQSAGPCS